MSSSGENTIELRGTTPPKDSSFLRTTHITSASSLPGRFSEDARLERLGKKPQLNRSFGFMSILGFSCSALLSWEGVLVNSVTALLNGGPAGVIWGFFINWMGTISVYAALGELTSIAPTAAGQCNSPTPRMSAVSVFTELTLTCKPNFPRSLGCHARTKVLQHIPGLYHSLADNHGVAGHWGVFVLPHRDAPPGHSRVEQPTISSNSLADSLDYLGCLSLCSRSQSYDRPRTGKV